MLFYLILSYQAEPATAAFQLGTKRMCDLHPNAGRKRLIPTASG